MRIHPRDKILPFIGMKIIIISIPIIVWTIRQIIEDSNLEESWLLIIINNSRGSTMSFEDHYFYDEVKNKKIIILK